MQSRRASAAIDSLLLEDEYESSSARIRKRFIIYTYITLALLFAWWNEENLVEECIDEESELSTAEDPVGTGDESPLEADDAKSTSLHGRKRKKRESSASSSSQGRERTSQAFCDALKRMADSFHEILMMEREIVAMETKKATVEEVLRELKVVDLDELQTIKAVDIMMQDQIAFETFAGLPSDLKKPWVLMHIEK